MFEEIVRPRPRPTLITNKSPFRSLSPLCFMSFWNNSYDVTDNKTNDLHSKQRLFIMNDNFHREDERLKTFENWPLDWLDKKQLALTGMFFTGDEDKVKCYFCEVEIGRWELEDQPVPEHLRWSPNCPLLRRRTTNNVPINAEELNHILPPISYDVCGTNETYEARPNFYAEYPEYAIEASRERSFTEWPGHMKQTPAQMAEAGFFHSGIGDRVKCFSCGGGLKDWDDSDDPWEQHALWLPKCRFLKLMKGQNFIDAVIAKQKSLPPSNDNESNDDANCGSSSNSSSISCSPLPQQVPPQQLQQQHHQPQQQQPQQQPQQQQLEFTTATVLAATEAPPNVMSDALNSTSDKIEPNLRTTNCGAEIEASSSTVTATATATAACDRTSSVCSEAERRAPNNSNNSSNIPEEKLCKICYTNEYNTAFLPCGHVVACAKCASSVTKCPMCRKHFTDIMRVYFS